MQYSSPMVLLLPVEIQKWSWFVLKEKYCWLVAGGWFFLREKYCWLVVDKPDEQSVFERGLVLVGRWHAASSGWNKHCFLLVIDERSHIAPRIRLNTQGLGSIYSSSSGNVPMRFGSRWGVV
jgi:hypothetical protein